MVFHQATLDSIEQSTIINAIFKNQEDVELKHCSFNKSSEINDLTDALDIIEAKRKTLKIPYDHSFLCIEIPINGTMHSDDIIKENEKIISKCSQYFKDDLFVIGMVYLVDDNLRSVICLSDIECSLDCSTNEHLDSKKLHQLMATALNNYDSMEIDYNNLYLFNAKAEPLAYDGVIHVKVHYPLTPKTLY